MYQVSEQYLIAIGENARAHKLIGTVNGVSFRGSDVIRNSFSIRNQICDATKISLGGVYIGELDLTFSSAFALRMNIRGSWKGKQITASIGVELADGSFEYIPVNGGTYTIESAQWVDEGLKIVAYDNMAKFDDTLRISLGNGRAYDYLAYACQRCGVELGMTEDDFLKVTNGAYLVYPYPNNAMETYRDLISSIATMCACYATIDRDSKLVLRSLPSYNESVLVIPASLRYSTSFSDYSSYYTSLEVTNPSDGTISHYSNGNIGGLTLDIGDNPFLEVGVPDTYNSMRRAIINKLQDFRATPFSVSLLPDPALDLGDQIVFAGGIGQDSLGCIMSITHRLDCTIIEGYGESPATSGITSDINKKVSAQARSNKDEVITHIFTNVQPFELGEEEQVDVIEIAFATVSPQAVKMLHEIKMNVTITSPAGVATCKAYYYINGVLEDYQPITSWDNDGYHLLHLIYATEELVSGLAYKWKVRLVMSGGTATIDRNSIIAILEGQGLAADDTWDGTITVSDFFSLNSESDTTINFIDGDITVHTAPVDHRVEISDFFGLVSAGETDINFIDSPVNIITRTNVFNLVTQDGKQLVTQDSRPYITNGGSD